MTAVPSKRSVQKVAFVVPALIHGGAEHQVADLAAQLSRWDDDVTVIALGKVSEALAQPLRDAGVRVVALQAANWRQRVWRVAAELRRHGPDVVHSHLFAANIAARLARPLARVPVLVSTTHNLGESEPPFRTRYWALRYRLTEPLCDLTTTVCAPALERYVQAGAVRREKARVVHNGIDVERYRRDERRGRETRLALGLERRPVILAIGRIDSGKGYDDLLRAIARLTTTDATLLIVGAGPDEERLLQLCRELDITDRVRFLGLREDIPELLSAADVYVMSSHTEALPLVLLEAGAASLPVVTTDVGGTPEAVAPEASVLVPDGEPAALAAAIDHLLSVSEAERRRMGERGAAFVADRFALDSIAREWTQIYSMLRLGRRSVLRRLCLGAS